MTLHASLVLIDPRTIVREHFICLTNKFRPLFNNVITFSSISDFIVEYHRGNLKVSMIVLGVGTVMYAEESVKTLRSVLKKPVATVLFDDHFKYAMIKYMIRDKINGYLTLFSSSDNFFDIAKLVLEGKRVISQDLGKVEIIRCHNYKDLTWLGAPHFFKLSKRESELFRLLVQGEELAECSERMGITIKSTENLKTRLMQKLNVHSTTSLILQGVKFGLGHY